jgi:hypothetical protein
MLFYPPMFCAFFIFAFGSCFGNNLYHFSLPLFDKLGTKICDIFGQRADLSDGKILKISDICIRNISQNAAKSDYTVSIASDQAIINPSEILAMGKGFISISSDEFSANGSDWQFSGKLKKFTINENVQALFKRIQINGE